MKKIIIAIAIVSVTVFAKAATVGWSMAGCNAYANDAYQFFIIGENGVASVAQITALLDAGTGVGSYAFGSGTVAANGNATVLPSNSGKTLTPTATQSYTGFFVLFDSAAPTSGTSKYVAISGATGLAQSIAPTTASKTFAAGNASTQGFLADSNWKSFGPSGAPEPTSGLLLLIGGAMIALRRKQK